MALPFIGRSGRTYTKEKLLEPGPFTSAFDIYLVKSKDQFFVAKPVTSDAMHSAERLKKELGHHKALRTHVDEHAVITQLIYEVYKTDLQAFIESNPSVTMKTRKLILLQVAEGLKALHDHHWIHLGVKPDCVVLDWSHDEDKEEMRIDRVALGEMDYASPREEGEVIRFGSYGAVPWRCPEGQLSAGWDYPADVFAFGLLCLFTVTGAQTMHPSFRGIKEDGIDPLRYVLSCLLNYFGPPPEGLLKVVGEKKAKVMISIWEEDYLKSVGVDELGPFSQWDETRFPLLDPDTKRFLSRMLNLDPAQRPTMTEVLEDPWWK